MPPSTRFKTDGRPQLELPADPELEQRAVAGLFVALLSLAGLLGLNTSSGGIYIAGFALVAGIVALWLSGTAMARAGRARAARPRGGGVAVAIGSTGVLLSVILLATFAVLGHQISQYGRCMDGANTIATQQSCSTQFNHSLTHTLRVLRSGGHP